MKQRITRLSPHQNGKVFGMLSAIVSLPGMTIVHVLMNLSLPATDRSAYIIGFPLFMYVLFPLVYFVLGYLSVAIACLVYNILHRFIGGIEWEIALTAHNTETAQHHRRKLTALGRRLLLLSLLLALMTLFIDQIAADSSVSATPPAPSVHAQDCGSLNGIALPCWDDYLSTNGLESSESLPYYPYAKRPNGCSIPGSTPGTNDAINIAGITISFTDICHEHDRCYYTLGTTPWQCNAVFHQRLRSRCAAEFAGQPLNGFDVLTGGTARQEVLVLCNIEAAIMASAVIGVQDSRHHRAQERQRDYLERVERFLR